MITAFQLRQVHSHDGRAGLAIAFSLSYGAQLGTDKARQSTVSACCSIVDEEYRLAVGEPSVAGELSE